MTGEMAVARRAVSDALWAMCAADSMSMPVHWYYNVDDIRRDFGGWISGFTSPRDTHPSSILSLSNTAGSGRTAGSTGATRPDVVGNVILHDKLELWKSSRGSAHYHQGLQAGDNTLNVLCSLRAARSLVAGRFTDVSAPAARGAVLADYVRFMTTPGEHRDSYAESSHRAFFSSWQDDRPTAPWQVLAFAEERSRKALSSSPPDGQLDAIGCLPMILPFILLSASANQEQAVGDSLARWKHTARGRASLIRTNMASVSRVARRLFVLRILLFIASLPACTGLPGVIISRPVANGVLRRGRRANSFLFEELRRGDVERECQEEKCSYEEAREIFPLPQQLETFWRRYTAVNHCLLSPCKNGATCTRHGDTYACQCPPGYHGHNCDKARVTSSSCYFNNGECEHFCRHVPEPVCFCAPGYRLHQDGRTCTPQVAVACGRLQTHFAPSVINGMICPKGHCPWQALLTEHGNFSCGAIVLSRRWVLTAAHCVWAKPASIFNVTVGEHDLHVHEGTEQQRAVVKVLVHPGYNMSQHGHDSDVAMLRLQRPVKLGLYVVPVCLPARNSTFSHTLGTVRHSTVSGWGRLAQFGATAGVLQRLTLPRVSLQECQQHTRLNITRNMFCAGLKAGGRDACKGDSGGPMVTYYKKTWFLTGVVSWGKDCAKENLYGVYAKVSRFVDWIQGAMANN